MHVERWSYIEFRSNYVLDQTGENNYYKFLSRNVVKVKKKNQNSFQEQVNSVT